MALAVGGSITSSTNTSNQSSGGTTTVGYNSTTGSDRLLIVNVAFWNNGGAAAGCSGITYGGVAMTLVTNSRQLSTGNKFLTEQWYLVAPATGTNNVVATVGGQCDKLGLAVLSFTGADQTNPIDVNGKTSGTSGTVTQSITTTVAGTIMTDSVSHLSANTATANSHSLIYNDGASGAGMASQYGTAASAGTNSLSWTYPDPGDEWAYSVLAVRPSSGSPAANTAAFFALF